MTEAFLQYVWQHKMLQGDLRTTEGLPVLVERAGDINTDAGPDFFDARVQIGEVLWAGNVEIHLKASDWKQHGHSDDKRYNNVVLHVVYTADSAITLENGKQVPTLSICDNIPDHIWQAHEQMMHPAIPLEIACMPRLKEVPDFIFQGYEDRLTVERIERKALDVQRLLEDSHGNWETTCYWITARYFGGKLNAFGFEMLAKMTPMRILAKIKDKPFRVEALLMGQAGLLEGKFKDEYPQKLQKEYNYMRIAYDLTPMEGHLWKFFRLRPASFPTLRISQLADLISRSSNLFSHLMETTDVKQLRNLFLVSASDYWQTHYNFDKAGDPRPKSAGQCFADVLVINAWSPLLFEYGVQHGCQTYKERAVEFLRRLPPEYNKITRLWGADYRPQNAAQSQALIQLYNEHCTKKDCLRCQLGYQLLGGNERRVRRMQHQAEKQHSVLVRGDVQKAEKTTTN
jgi:hypothetical protein